MSFSRRRHHLPLAHPIPSRRGRPSRPPQGNSMIAATHALTGAALSQICRTPAQAFFVGALSHLVADALPHRDLDLPEEGILLAGALTLVAVTRGSTSPAFAGAVGAVAPDIENVLARLLGIPDEKLLLPTHRDRHGPKTPGLQGQAALVLGCLAALAAPGLLRRFRDR